MSETFITRERVFFSASALTAAGLGVVALKLIQRHREQEDDITLEGAEKELADRFQAHAAPASDKPIDSDVVYLGIDDDDARISSASEVHAIGDSKHFTRLKRRIVNGAVHLRDVMKQDD